MGTAARLPDAVTAGGDLLALRFQVDHPVCTTSYPKSLFYYKFELK